ncbi:PAS domain S-box protein [Cyclobacterium sp.]|uniref:PAS domain S-box protein n=1 Tax=Cyclobacterium sp. TaxID=1966343 RepID=UPI0019CEFC06|nr:PAS domain S-box protein [Cyclobacterium sp.]MBD3630878.1 PAS domain S-box protein [Cyclobacterium sp.]
MERKYNLGSWSSLKDYKLLDTLPEKEYNDVAAIASQICRTPISLITFLDSDRQFFKAHHGLELSATPIDQSICLHAVKSKEDIFVVPDARKDPRFKDNPLVKGDPHIVFYAGVPLITPNGNSLGALCVIDTKPRKINNNQKASLTALADQVIKLVELRKKHFELEETKKSLQKEKNRLHNIIEATRVGTFEWNVKTSEVRINSRWAEIVGYTLEELQPVNMDTWYKLVHPDDVAHSDAALKDCFDRKTEFYDIELRMIHKAGHEVWINDRGRVVKWSEDGGPLLMSGTHTDITERKNTEIQFKTLNDNIPGVVYRYKLYPDGTDELQLVSNGANLLWGIPSKKAMENNQLVWARYHKEDLIDHKASIKESAENLSFWTHEWRYHHPDGSERWHKGTGMPKRMEDGSTVWDAVILDITEKKLAQIRLNNTLVSLNERIKEQHCLYQITRFCNQEIDIDHLLSRAAEVLLSGWQYPEQTGAQIEYGGKIYVSPGFEASEDHIHQQFTTKEGKPLHITITFNSSPQSKKKENSFLREERQLLETITHNLVTAIDQKEASRQLKESNSKIADLIQSIDGIVWEADVETLEFNFISKQVETILGFTPEEWRSDPEFWQKHIHPEDKFQALNYCATQTKAGRDHSFEYRMKAADGRDVWINDLVTLVKENGKPVALRGLMVDITQQKQVEKELALSEKRFRALVQEGADLTAIVNKEGDYQYVSPNYPKIIGFDENELLGKSSFDFFHPEDLPRVKKEFEKLGKEKRLKSNPFRFRNKNGNWSWLQSAITDLSEDESVGGIVVNSVDLTDLIEIQEKLKTSEARYRGFYESQTNFVIRTDLEGNYSYVNKKFIEDFGWIYPDGKIIGKSCMPSICEYDHQGVIAVVEKCLSRPEEVFKIELDKPRQGGGILTTLWDFICIVDGNGNPTEIQCMGIDISERVAFERALKKSNERYEFVNRATNDAIYDWDVINDHFEWGEGFHRIFGYEEGKGITKLSDWPKLKHPMELDHDQEKWDTFMADSNKFRWHEESRMRKADGTYLVIEEIGHLIRDDDGNPLRMIGVLRDISEKKKEETQKMLQGELAYFFKEEAGLSEILRKSVQYLTSFGNFKAAEIWLAGNDHTQVFLSCSYTAGLTTNWFYQDKIATTKLNKGEGFPGKVWQSSRGEIWNDLGDNELFLRKDSAKKMGLLAALGLPILYNDQPIGVLVFFSDEKINEQERNFFLPIASYLGTEIRRKQQEEEMVLMFQSAPEILAIASPRGHFTKVNPAFCEILGYEEDEIVGQPFINFLHPEDLDQSRREFIETVSGLRQAKNYTNRYRTKSGEFKWISWNSSRPFGEEGLVFAYGYDISQMKELQSLHNNATQLARVGSWEIDIPGNKLYLSQITKEIYGIDQIEEMDVDESIEFYREDVRDDVKEVVETGISTGKGWDFEMPLINSQGKEIWVRSIGEAEFMEGKCIRLYGSLQDIHNRKLLEQQLERRNELLSAISKVIGTFLQTEDWYQALNKVFEITGKVAMVDRVYYFENHLDPENGTKLCSQRFEWTNERVNPQIDNPVLQNIHVEEFSEFFVPLEKGQTYQVIMSEPPDGTRFKDVLQEQGIKSCLVLPIMMDKKFFGFIGFDDCTTERVWTESEISFLQNISSNLSAAIQRRNSQLYLQKAYDEKNTLLESIGEAFFSLDKEWRVMYWNKNAEKLLGIKRNEILGFSLWEKFSISDETKFYDQYVNAIENQCPVTFEEYYPPLNLWLEVNASPSEEGISVFFRDVTERKQAAEQIRQSNERFEKISEATNDAIWDFDVENNRLMWGKGFSTLFGYDLEKIKPDFDFLLGLIHPEDRARVGRKISEYMQSTSLTNWFEEYRFLMADGYYAFVMDRAVFIRNKEGKVSRVVGAMTDISYRKEYEESLQALNQQLEQRAKELEVSNKELEQFAYVASHDLQEPLRMVSSFIGLLERKYGNVLDEKAHQYINFAVGGAKRMRQIILDLLEYSRVGKNEEGLKIIQLDDILDEVCLLHRKAISEKKARIEYHNLPALITFKSPMTQLFSNLVGNALRYSSPDVPPLINISAKSENDRWLFAVSDNGIGIDPQFHEKIFIIFQSLHNKEKYGGTGMGLAIVKKIIENLGGKIWVESDEGRGSTFYFTFPKVENDHEENV